jgi:hypothetical protein
MHRNPIPGIAPDAAEDSFDGALLGLLIHHDTVLWSIAELSRSMSSSTHAAGVSEAPTHQTEDSIERLHAAGLIHRVGRFVFATRAAHAAQRLAS